MDLFDNLMSKAVDKLKDGPWKEAVKARLNARSHERMRREAKRQAKWELLGFVSDSKDPSKALVTRSGHKVPVHRFVGYDYGKKYTGEKLREIRREQALKALVGKTHYDDGTEIVRDRIIDLYEGAQNAKAA